VRRLVAVDELLLGFLLVLFRRFLFLGGFGGLRRGGFRLGLSAIGLGLSTARAGSASANALAAIRA
jgi:hypothetical protein